jgi:hypothetical protein
MIMSGADFHSSNQGIAKMTGRHCRSILLVTGSAAAMLIHGSASAQVAPTEVHESLVDEFGVERTTGRFVWSSGEIIGIGGENARLGISVTGIFEPVNVTTVLPAGPSLRVTLNVPRLSIAPRPVDFPRFHGEVDPGRNYVTVEYGGAYTFDCNGTVCTSQYLYDHTLVPSGSGYLYTSRNRTKVLFQPEQVTIDHPDGRQEIIQANGVWRNNFGFMLRLTGTGSTTVTAVNLARDFCVTNPQTACGPLQASRAATLPSSPASPLQITDAAGGVTKLRYVQKTAKERRPLNPPLASDPYIPDLPSNYLLGVMLPGSTSEDVTVTYGAHDPAKGTHDDIRVSSVTKGGILANYEMAPYWPYGRDIPRPDPSSGVGGAGFEGYVGVVFSGWLNHRGQGEPEGIVDDLVCTESLPSVWSGDPDHSSSSLTVCTRSGGGGGWGGGPGLEVPSIPLEPPPPDPASPELYPIVGSQIFELVIRTRVNGELVSTSAALRPYSQEGMARRRLLWVRDGLGRQTQFYYSEFDEMSGKVLPEGNGLLNGNDERGNINVSVGLSKTDPNAGLQTSYGYPVQCDASNNNWCNSPVSVTDPKGSVTNYEYNQYGQVTKEMKPAPSLGAGRPTVVNEYTLRTAYIKNSAGAPVAAGPAISLLTRSYTCISSATCNASTPAADRVVTDYDYGPTTGLNNLLLRGIAVTAVNDQGQIQTLRTCYGYNYFGERISETLPKAGLSSCPA